MWNPWMASTANVPPVVSTSLPPLTAAVPSVPSVYAGYQQVPPPTAPAVPFMGTSYPNGVASPTAYPPPNYPGMSPEQQQLAWQQHYQQWQQYQQEYARWHEQYGEQYKRDMEKVAGYSYYQQQPALPPVQPPLPPAPSQETTKPPPPAGTLTQLTGKPQMYTKPPIEFNCTKPPPPTPILNQPPPSSPILGQPPPSSSILGQSPSLSPIMSQPPPLSPNLSQPPPRITFNRPPPSSSAPFQKNGKPWRPRGQMVLGNNSFLTPPPNMLGNGYRNPNPNPYQSIYPNAVPFFHTSPNAIQLSNNSVHYQNFHNNSLLGPFNSLSRTGGVATAPAAPAAPAAAAVAAIAAVSSNDIGTNRLNGSPAFREDSVHKSQLGVTVSNNSSINYSNNSLTNNLSNNLPSNLVAQNSNNNVNVNNSLQSGVVNKGSMTNLGNHEMFQMVDEDQFDSYFQQWERQFEEWKRANVGHPDQAVYLRYRNEFESQRQRIISRREQVKKRKQSAEAATGQNHSMSGNTEVNVKEAMGAKEDNDDVVRGKEMKADGVPDVTGKGSSLENEGEDKQKEDKQKEREEGEKELTRENERQEAELKEGKEKERMKSSTKDEESTEKKEHDAEELKGEEEKKADQPEMRDLFTKPDDGIPGLDLVTDGGESLPASEKEGKAVEQTGGNERDDDEEEEDEDEEDDENTEKLVNSLNDPIFLKKISDAIATIKEKETPDQDPNSASTPASASASKDGEKGKEGKTVAASAQKAAVPSLMDIQISLESINELRSQAALNRTDGGAFYQNPVGFDQFVGGNMNGRRMCFNEGGMDFSAGNWNVNGRGIMNFNSRGLNFNAGPAMVFNKFLGGGAGGGGAAAAAISSNMIWNERNFGNVPTMNCNPWNLNIRRTLLNERGMNLVDYPNRNIGLNIGRPDLGSMAWNLNFRKGIPNNRMGQKLSVNATSPPSNMNVRTMQDTGGMNILNRMDAKGGVSETDTNTGNGVEPTPTPTTDSNRVPECVFPCFTDVFNGGGSAGSVDGQHPPLASFSSSTDDGQHLPTGNQDIGAGNPPSGDAGIVDGPEQANCQPIATPMPGAKVNATSHRKRRRRPRNKARQGRAKNGLQNNDNQGNKEGGGDEKSCSSNNAAESDRKELEPLEEISDTDSILDRLDAGDDDGSIMSLSPPPPPVLTDNDRKFLTSTNTTTAAVVPPMSATLPFSSATELLQISMPTAENRNTISIAEIVEMPGRLIRPKKLCVIIRGPPGSGKSHVAKLIKEKERRMGADSSLRVLSIDDYFLVETDTDAETDERPLSTGKKVVNRQLVYEYDAAMEATYMQYLIKSFKKTITDCLYDFVVIDCNNNSLRTLNEFYCHAKDNGFKPYIVDMFCDIEMCLTRNHHQHQREHIEDVIRSWNPTPLHYIKLDVTTLLENVVEMEDANGIVLEETNKRKEIEQCQETEQAQDSDKDILEQHPEQCSSNSNQQEDKDESSDHLKGDLLRSKWETDQSVEHLERLDGTSKLSMKRKLSMEDFLQQIDDVEEMDSVPADGKKRIRWADVEEERRQRKMREVGFVVGQTDWKRMMDPKAPACALKKTKYIPKVQQKS